MENFTDFKSLYDHLDKNATEYTYHDKIANLFKGLRDLRHKENKSEETEKAQWEVDFFNFMIEEGKLNPMFTRTNENGEVVKYPTLDRFDDRIYGYLIERLDGASNPLLKARYSNILWCSPKKHGKYAKIAIESYLKLVRIYEEKSAKHPDDDFDLDILDSIRNAYGLACQINDEKEQVKEGIERLIKSPFSFKERLIELILSDKKIFSKKDIERLELEKICWNSAKLEAVPTAINVLELGERIEQKLGRSTFNWRKRIAESYEDLMKQRKGGDSAAIDFCQKALENYKKINDKKKIKELQKRYSELKKSMKFTEFTKEIDLTEHIKICKDVAEKIVQNKSEEIIKVLMFDNNILPKYKDMEKNAEEQGKRAVFRQIVPEVIFDQRGHPSQHFSDKDEKRYLAILQQYDLELKLNKTHLINEIFFVAIRENKLSADILFKFLNRHSWFGKNISKKLTDQMIRYNWLNLIAPSLHEYFLQIQCYFANPNYPPNLILSIDSLTLKIEGLVRDICQFSGVPTFCMIKDDKGRSIVREKDIHALLYEDPIKRLFDEDDLLFFKFLLVEKAGYNLRHKIAHSLMLPQEYNINYMHLLILALLKLGKYDFAKKKDTASYNNG